MRKLRLLTVAVVVGICVLAQDAAKAASAADELGWQMAIHAYTFRKFSIFECIDKTAALGLKYMSLSGSVNLDGTRTATTVQLSDEDAAAIQKAVAAKGIKLVNIGVVKLPPEEAESRKVFEFAKKMGIDTLVAEPEPAALDTVEKLCKEYNIKVAIHNHPKPSHYWNPETVARVIKNRSHRIGACADTGHWKRSGFDPVECMKKLQGRIITFHFKDVKKEAGVYHDVPWGTGECNVRGMLEEAWRQQFKGVFSFEYEYHWENSVPEIAKSVEYFDKVAAEIGSQAVPANRRKRRRPRTQS